MRSLFLSITAALLSAVPASAIVDLDQDGWSDLWQLAYGHGHLPDVDSDGDGRTNWEEHNDGTDPADGLSKRPVPEVQAQPKGKMRFAWPTVAGKYYQLEVSFDGTTWADVGGPVMGNGSLVERVLDKNATYLGTGPLMSRYTGLADEPLIETVKAAVAAHTPPAEEVLIPTVETAQTSPNLEHYGEFIRGWLVPPADGTYVFWVAGNLATELSISSNSSAKKKTRIAFSDASTNFREWGKFATQKSEPVQLRGGKLYYLEVWQQETTGSDHVSVAWTGPGLNADKEIIDGAYITKSTETLGRRLAKALPTWRITVSDRDSDSDTLTDYEERVAGLDPFNSRSVSRIADLTTVTAMFSATNVVTVGAESQLGHEAEQKAARFIFFRSGNLNPITVHFTVAGTAQAGQDYAALSGSVSFGVGQTSATVDLLPLNDGAFEPAETVTASLTADPAYEIGSPASATVTIDDAANVVFVATMRPQDTKSGGYGYAALTVAGNKAFGDLSVTFGHLTSAELGADFYIAGAVDQKTPALVLPLGQVSAQRWTFDATGALTREQILAALFEGRLGARVMTSRFPGGEISGLFVKNWGWKEFQKPPKAGATLTKARDDGEAARFLNQATFGATTQEIKLVRKAGYPAWIEAQFKKPATKHLEYVQARRAELLARSEGSDDGYQSPRQEAWWQAVLASPDQLRQRTAFALSEIMVVSDVGVLESSHEGLTNYYDMLVKHAFGNFRDLLEDVTLSPVMGQYLSMARNQKPNPSTGSEPDENYAREVMQLLTIGLNMLNTDGSLALDANGLPTPTYTPNDIVGLAHIFTGWGSRYDPQNPPANLRDFFRYGEMDELNPMILYPDFHDTKAKRIVSGVNVAANVDGKAEMKLALDTLFNHPNVGPFIARQLIQRFVTSNPSRGYIYRVASAFNRNEQGKRGDMKATVKAVLMDPEARNPIFEADVAHGKLREPLLRVSGVLRAFLPPPPLAPDKRYFIDLSNSMAFQSPLKSPSVFNFFQPGYIPPGPLAVSGLFGPEFQITQETTVVTFTNLGDSILRNGIGTRERDSSGNGVSVRLDLAPYMALLDRTERTAEENQNEVISSLNVLLLGGKMSPTLSQGIRDAFTALPANFGTTPDRQRDRVRIAIYIIISSPEFAVQK
jgi:uncharacterized protein (DUF1800 family)